MRAARPGTSACVTPDGQHHKGAHIARCAGLHWLQVPEDRLDQDKNRERQIEQQAGAQLKGCTLTPGGSGAAGLRGCCLLVTLGLKAIVTHSPDRLRREHGRAETMTCLPCHHPCQRPGSRRAH